MAWLILSSKTKRPTSFPRSLMVGFRARAATSSLLPHSNDDSVSVLPPIDVDALEMEDVQWFHRDFVSQRLEGGSTALSYQPTKEEREFHIPGKASLARILITDWALETKGGEPTEEEEC